MVEILYLKSGLVAIQLDWRAVHTTRGSVAICAEFSRATLRNSPKHSAAARRKSRRIRACPHVSASILFDGWNHRNINHRYYITTSLDETRWDVRYRWCQSYGYLAKLPKDAGYPRKLCFQFGPMAVNWQDDQYWVVSTTQTSNWQSNCSELVKSLTLVTGVSQSYPRIAAYSSSATARLWLCFTLWTLM